MLDRGVDTTERSRTRISVEVRCTALNGEEIGDYRGYGDYCLSASGRTRGPSRSTWTGREFDPDSAPGAELNRDYWVTGQVDAASGETRRTNRQTAVENNRCTKRNLTV